MELFVDEFVAYLDGISESEPDPKSKRQKMDFSEIIFLSSADSEISFQNLTAMLKNYHFTTAINGLIKWEKISSSSAGVLIDWKDYIVNEENLRQLYLFKGRMGSQRLIVLYNRFLGSSDGSILLKRPPLVVNADVHGPFSAGLARLPLIRQYESQIFQKLSFEIACGQSETNIQINPILAGLSGNIEDGQKEILMISTSSSSIACPLDDTASQTLFEATNENTPTQDLNSNYDVTNVIAANSDPIFLKHPPFCNFQLVDVIQKVKRGIDHETSFFERFHILNNYSNWNILIPSVCKVMLTNLYEIFKAKKSCAHLLLGPSGAGKSHALFVIALFFCSQVEHNMRVLYIPDCLMWAKSDCPVKFILCELLFSLSFDDFASELMDFLPHCRECKNLGYLLSELSDWAEKLGLQILFVFDQVLLFSYSVYCRFF